MRIALQLTMAMIAGAFFGANAQSKVPHAQLSLVLREQSSQTVYHFKDSIAMVFEIDNNGPIPVGVYAKLGMGYQGGVIIHVLDEAGREIPPPVLAHDVLDMEDISNPANYFELQTGQFWGMQQSFHLNELVEEPGSYTIFAEYHCPVDPKVARVSEFWSIEKPSIISNKINISVQ